MCVCVDRYIERVIPLLLEGERGGVREETSEKKEKEEEERSRHCDNEQELQTTLSE